MKKKIILICIIILLLILIGAYMFFNNSKFKNVKETANLILKTAENDNIYAVFTIKDLQNNTEEFQEIYVKSNIKLTKNNTKENLIYQDFNVGKEIFISKETKSFYNKTLTDLDNILINSWFYALFDTSDYEFVSCEKIKNVKYVVFNLKTKDSTDFYKMWLEEDTGFISKVEYYTNGSKIMEYTYEYELNKVKDEDIVEPKEEDYSDYQIYG